MSNQQQSKTPIDLYVLALRATKEFEVASGAELLSRERKPKKVEDNPVVVDKDIKDLLTKVSGMQIVNSIGIGVTGKFLKFSYPTVSVGVTNIVWTKIGAFFNDMPNRRNEIYDLIDSYVSTNSSVMAQLTRLKEQMPNREFMLKYTSDMVLYVNKKLPITPITEVVTIPDFSRSEIFSIIPSADAGMPFMAYPETRSAKCGDVEIYKKAIQLCDKYMVLLSHERAMDASYSDSFVNYMKDNPLEFLYIFKRKFERIKRENFHKKVRTYFVAPYALKMLFKWVSFYIRGQSQNFIENIESASAYKFSWSHGGADKIMHMIFRSRTESFDTGKLVFKAICFGDDQLWVFTFPSGHIDVCAPDFVSMDTHVNNVVGIQEIARHVRSFETEPSQLYQNVCKLLAKQAFIVRAVLNGSIIVNKLYGLNSGIPLTTQLDIHASVLSHKVVESQVKMLNVGKTNFKPFLWTPQFTNDFLNSLSDLIPSRVGLRFKEGTLTVQTYLPASTGSLLLKFLGCKIKFSADNDSYYPEPDDLEMCWVSLALPSSPIGSKAAMGLTMARIYGLLMSGYCLNHSFDTCARELFEYIKKQGGILVIPPVDEFVMNKFDIQKFIELHPYPPSKEEIIRFYCSDITMMEQNYINNNTPANSPIHSLGENVPLPVSQDLVDYVDYNFDFAMPKPQTISVKHIGGALPKTDKLTSIPLKRLVLSDKKKNFKLNKNKDINIDSYDRFDQIAEEYESEEDDDPLTYEQEILDAEEAYQNRFSLGKHEALYGGLG
jgi:hypothetical protein